MRLLKNLCTRSSKRQTEISNHVNWNFKRYNYLALQSLEKRIKLRLKCSSSLTVIKYETVGAQSQNRPGQKTYMLLLTLIVLMSTYSAVHTDTRYVLTLFHVSHFSPPHLSWQGGGQRWGEGERLWGWGMAGSGQLSV
jgi:hypothetical protein